MTYLGRDYDPGQEHRGVAITDPRHWSHHRSANTDAERRELIAATWQPVPEFERALALRAHPDVFGRLPYELQGPALDEYEERRKVAAAAGRVGAEPDAALAKQASDEARALAFAQRMLAEADVDEPRAAFYAAVKTGPWEAIVSSFAAWLAAQATRRKEANRVATLEVRLGLAGAAMPVVEPPLTFLPEFAAAVDSITSPK